MTAELPLILVILCYENHHLVHLPTGIKSTAVQAGLAMTNIVISFFGTLANALVIMAYYRDHRLRTIQNRIFFLLAVTDICVTAFVQPIFAVATLGSLLGKHSCILWVLDTVFSFPCMELSLVTVVILSLQSYITLAYPYHWQSVITRSRLNMVILCSWFLVLLKALAMFENESFVVYGFLCIVCITLLTVVTTWCWTYRLVGRHRKQIQAAHTPSRSQNVAQTKILRSTITAFAIISGFLTCYFLNLCLLSFQSFLNASRLGHDTYGILLSASLTLMYLNSLLNPCLVFWRNSCFRQAVKNIFSRNKVET